MTKADILFIHNNFPGQYRHIAANFAARADLRVFAIGSATASDMDGVYLQRYRLTSEGVQSTHSFAQRFDLECRRAEQIIYAANVLKLEGMVPKIIFVHPGWGEALPLRQLFPRAKICVYCEFYYNAHGADVGFDPEFKSYGIDGLTRIQLRNAATLLALADADLATSPTKWQQSMFPAEFRSKIKVIHDGLDVDKLVPGNARFSHPLLPRALKSGDEVLTFVSRGLEPYRGFHIFMRALPHILAARPQAQVCIVGGDQVAYGSPPPNAGSWKSVMLTELSGKLDLTRVHFLDRLAYDQLTTLLRISRVHVYLTYPFVLSWSLLEAMALGCLVVASDVAPVQEVITNGENGFLVPFLDAGTLANKTTELLAKPGQFEAIRRRASAGIHARYHFEKNILPQFHELLADLAPDFAKVA